MDGFEVAARRRAGSDTAIVLASSRDGADFGPLVIESGRAASSPRRSSRAMPSVPSSHDSRRGYSRTSMTDLVVATPVFLDLTFVGLESLPVLGEERFAAELLRSPGGGAITAVAAARLGLSVAVAAPLGDDVAGDIVRTMLPRRVSSGSRPVRALRPTTVVMPFGGDRAMVTIDPGARARPPTWPPASLGRSPRASTSSTSSPTTRRRTSRAATTTSVRTRVVRPPHSAALRAVRQSARGSRAER